MDRLLHLFKIQKFRFTIREQITILWFHGGWLWFMPVNKLILKQNALHIFNHFFAKPFYLSLTNLLFYNFRSHYIWKVTHLWAIFKTSVQNCKISAFSCNTCNIFQIGWHGGPIGPSQGNVGTCYFPCRRGLKRRSRGIIFLLVTMQSI